MCLYLFPVRRAVGVPLTVSALYIPGCQYFSLPNLSAGACLRINVGIIYLQKISCHRFLSLLLITELTVWGKGRVSISALSSFSC